MKVRIPLVERTREGEPCPTPAVTLKVRDRQGTFAEVKFRVDTQADVATMPVSLAEKEPVPCKVGRQSRRRQGRAGAWSQEDQETARLQANALSWPHGAHGRTPDQLWSVRPVLSAEECAGFLASLAGEQEALGSAAERPEENALSEREKARRQREAIRRALVAHGIFYVTRRSIPLPITLRKLTKIP